MGEDETVFEKMRYLFEFDGVDGTRSTAPHYWVEFFAPGSPEQLAPEVSVKQCSAASAQAGPFEIDPWQRHPTQNGWYNFGELDIAVDAERRDGEVHHIFSRGPDSETGRLVNISSDRTSRLRPFRFWINNDQDDHPDEIGETAEIKKPDSTDGVIKTMRDLEDFAPLTVCVGGLAGPVAAGLVQVRLEWRETGGTKPSIRIFPKCDAYDASTRYRVNTDDAAPYVGLATSVVIAAGTSVTLPPGLLVSRTAEELGWTDLTSHFIFEGVKEGKGELVLTIDGQPGPGVWIELMDVKRMYMRAKANPMNVPSPYLQMSGQPDPEIGFVDDPNGPPFVLPPGETHEVITYVHGINAPGVKPGDEAYDTWIADSETVFKRLWWQGFRGRFASFHWPALTAAPKIWPPQLTPFAFNESEYRGWKSGRGLAAFLNSPKIPQNYKRNLYSFSQGAAVCGSALTVYGLSVDNYVIGQGAVPAGCYDTREEVNQYADFLDAETQRPTPDWNGNYGYRQQLEDIHVSGTVASFYNTGDYALKTGRTGNCNVSWEGDQLDFKPDVVRYNLFGAPQIFYLYYSRDFDDQHYAGKGWLFNSGGAGEEREVANDHESMAFVARPRSEAVGATGRTLGAVTYTNNVGRGTLCDFRETEEDHGGQFNRSIQRTRVYYSNLVGILSDE